MKKGNLIKPPLRQSLFWDTDIKKIDLKKHAAYVMERILDFGKDKEVKWMWQTYGRPRLKKIVRTSRVLQPQTKALWTLLLKDK